MNKTNATDLSSLPKNLSISQDIISQISALPWCLRLIYTMNI